MPQIMTRKEAHSKSHRKYWTGQPCRHGHLTYRYTNSGVCAGCAAAHQQRYKPVQHGVVRVVLDLHREDAALVQALGDSLRAARLTAPARLAPPIPAAQAATVEAGGPRAVYICRNCRLMGNDARGCSNCGGDMI